jgi:anti-sigma B factor antagonist
MDLTIKQTIISESIAIIEVAGEVDSYTSPRFREVMVDLVNSGHIKLIININEIEFLASTGVGVLVGVLKRVHARNGKIILISTNERNLKILRIMGLTKVFKIIPSISEAVALISDPGFKQEAEESEIADDDSGSYWFPARVYTSNEEAGEGVERYLRELLEAIGMQVVYEFPVLRESWFREFLVRMKDSTATPTRDELLTLMARAIEQQTFDKPQSQIDLVQSQAVFNLLAALEKTPKAAVQVGSLLVVKVQDVIVVRNLTQLELAYWQRHPHLFRDPDKALQQLQGAVASEVPADEPSTQMPHS